MSDAVIMTTQLFNFKCKRPADNIELSYYKNVLSFQMYPMFLFACYV